ncbi:MAG: YccF domain-containing protein [Oscillospiraceae bacterium]|nr:YccF domain-containing protein [Oscillospiraceae bacterium]
MRTLGNLLWVLLGGALLALLWYMAGLILCCTIIGIPLGIQCFKLGTLMLWPFGRDVLYGGGAGSCLLNLVWNVLFGWELAGIAATCGVLWCCTIVGIPFGLQFFKFAKLAFSPFGAEIVEI